MRFTNSLAFKMAGIVIAVEVLTLVAIGYYYDNRFREQVDRRIVHDLQAPSRLMKRGLLRYDAVADQTIMGQLVGEELEDGMVVGVNGNVFHALNPADLGKNIATIPGILIPTGLSRQSPRLLLKRSLRVRMPILSASLISLPLMAERPSCLPTSRSEQIKPKPKKRRSPGYSL